MALVMEWFVYWIFSDLTLSQMCGRITIKTVLQSCGFGAVFLILL